MKIRLRKAQAVLSKARELLDEDRAVSNIHSTVTVHVTNSNPVDAWLAHKTSVESKLNQYFELQQAVDWLTVATVEAGSSVVSVLLKKIALAKNHIKVLQKIVEALDNEKLTNAQMIAQAIAEKQHDDKGEKSNIFSNQVKIFWADQAALDHYADELHQTRKQLLKWEDDLAAANLNIEITLPPEIIAVLDKHSLV